MARRTTIRDVARVARVSVGTVSATMMRPRLTTVAQPIEDMGRIAAERFLEGLDAESSAARRPPHLAPRLPVRDSCRRFRAHAGGAA